MSVIVKELRKRYQTVEAVRGISFVVEQGEIFGLLGPNGAGKTSTVEILEGFRPRDGGDVSVLGLDPAVREQRTQLRSRIGVVLQQTGHYRFLSVAETLSMHAAFHDDPRSVDEVLELVELADCKDRRVRRLSGGQQRRLDVAVALVGRPELIFLDEPTTGFDPAARQRAWGTIAALRDLGTTVVLTTHYMEEAQALADRVAIISRGEIVQIGNTHEIAQNLELGSFVSFQLPSPELARDLPAPVTRELSADEAGLVSGRTQAPAPLLAVLSPWAVSHGLELDDLQVRPGTLEEAYLALTSEGASAATDAIDDGARAAAQADAEAPESSELVVGHDT